MRKVSGFTLIELLVVILILGILAATALPKFIDLSTSARNAARDGFKGAIESASALNYGSKLAGAVGATSLQTCTTAALGAIMTGGMSPGISVSGAFLAGTTANGSVNTCTIEYSASGGTANTTVSVIAVN